MISSISAYMIFVKDPPNSNDVSPNGSLKVDNDLHSFLNEHAELFIDDILSELPPKRGDDDHRIDLIPRSSPPNKPPYRVSQAQHKEIMSQVNELVQKGMLDSQYIYYATAAATPRPSGPLQITEAGEPEEPTGSADTVEEAGEIRGVESLALFVQRHCITKMKNVLGKASLEVAKARKALLVKGVYVTTDTKVLRQVNPHICTSWTFKRPCSFMDKVAFLSYGGPAYPQLVGASINHAGRLSQQLHRKFPLSWRHISSTAAIQHQEIGMPSLSPTMTQGNIAKWRKKEGDQVAPGDVLCEIETDKATLEMEAMDEGFLAKILCGDGSKDIPVGQPIAVVVDSEEEIANFKDYKPESGGSSPPPSKREDPPPPKEEEAPKASPAPKPTEPPKSKSEPTKSSTDDRVFASPLARKIAEEKNVPLTSLKGTGPNGRIVKADVEEAIASGAASAPQKSPEKPLQSLDFTDIPNTQIRKITAQRLLSSKQTIPHYYLTVDTRVDNLLALRSKLNTVQEASSGKRISINDFVLKAAAMALRKVPECNSSWTDEYIRQYHNVNISVAVQTDVGLLVPVVQNADKKGLAAIADDVKTLADKAKRNSLKPADYEGGTFTVSNLGGPFGVKQFCAIINPPQSCILAVGTTDKRVLSDSEGGFTTATYMSATLSCDHRVVDGAIGARWLGAFKGYIEDPLTHFHNTLEKDQEDEEDDDDAKGPFEANQDFGDDDEDDDPSSGQGSAFEETSSNPSAHSPNRIPPLAALKDKGPPLGSPFDK
ncbi:hypothetical protein L7F22_048010 [Adiantum nelumboides]|nr:hypothetical protein [Adiantum nelumboides]